MPCRIVKSNRVVTNVAVSIPTLRVGWVWNDGIRLDKAVNIRRIPPLEFINKKVKYNFIYG
jgi:hypothetical protein